MTDLSNFSLGDLRGLQEQVKAEIQQRQQQEVVNARAQIEQIARSVGMTVQELMPAKTKKTGNGAGTVATIKYQDSDDKSKKWSGRGRQPGWLKDALNNGKTLSDFEVK